MVSPSLQLKALHVEIRGMVLEQLWHSSNLPFNRQARRSKNRLGVSVFSLLKKRKYESKFSASFCLAIQREWEEGRKYRTGEKIHKRETNNTHAHTHEGEKKTRDIINIWIPYANGRERADVVAFNWPICELHPNLSVGFLGPLWTVFTGLLVPLNIWAVSSSFLAAFKPWDREIPNNAKSDLCYL